MKWEESGEAEVCEIQDFGYRYHVGPEEFSGGRIEYTCQTQVEKVTESEFNGVDDQYWWEHTETLGHAETPEGAKVIAQKHLKGQIARLQKILRT